MSVNQIDSPAVRLNEALNEVNASIGATLEYDEIMDRVLVVASRALEAPAAGVLLRDGHSWVVRYVYGYPPEVVGRRFSGQEMPHARMAIDSRDVFVVPDVASDPRVPKANAAAYAVTAMMVVPVIVRDEPMGALFFNYGDGPVSFTPEQIEFGQRLARSISLALDNARLYEAERQGRILFEAMFDYAPTGILLLEGPELRAVMANDAYLQFLGEPWRTNGVAGARLEDFAPGSEASGLAARFRAAAATGQPEVAPEYYLIHPQRGETYLRWTAAAVPLPWGQQPKVMFLLSDITAQVQARKRAETLAAQVREYADALEAANANLQAQAEELEVQGEELRTQNDELIEVQQALREAHDRLDVRVKERTAELAAANAALAAREASIQDTARSLQNEVAERKHAEEVQAAQAATLREQAELLELTYDTVLVRDLSAHILYWNRGAEERYGYKREEVLGLRSHSLLKTKFPEPVQNVYATLLETGYWEGELVHTTKEGREIVVASRWALQRDSRGEPRRVLETNNDITAHKRAEQELWRHTRRLQILHEIDQHVLAAHSREEIAEAAVQHVRQMISCDRVAVLVFDFERDLARRLAVDTKGQTDIGTGSTASIGDFDISQEQRDGKVYVVDDLTREPNPSTWFRALISDGLHALVSVPLLVNGQLIGLLNLASKLAGAFTLADIDVARQVGDSLAVVLEQARLHESERKAREIAETLREATAVLAQSLDLDSVLDTVLASARRLVPYDSAQVLLLEEDECLVLRASHYAADESSGEGSARVSTRILEHEAAPALRETLVAGKTLLIPDTAGYPEWDRLPLLAQARSWLGLPLVAGGKVLGVLSICSDQPETFTTDHVRPAESLAGQAAVAIQNARLFRQVDAGRTQLQALSRRLVDIQEEERRYVARELHDEAGQSLTSLLVGLGLLGRELADRPELQQRVQELKEVTDGVMENLHRLSLRLRPASLDRLGLVPALRQHVETFLEENQLEGEFVSVGLDDVHLPPEVEITVYRVVQETLTNVARHAKATHVGVVLELHEPGDGATSGGPDVQANGDTGSVLAIIEDDGAGFDPVVAATRGRLGLFGMRERAEMMGGTFHVESAPGSGTTVFVEIPCTPRSAA